MIRERILKKYSNEFNFYCSKHINEIVFNQTSADGTIKYKDVVVLSQKNEYLKRVYWMKNAAGRNQIYDRINMLAQFYGNAVLLRYELPVMIITNTKDIFLKRLRRMKKMIASDCSSDESEEQESDEQSSQPLSFESSRFLRTIKTEQLSSNKESRQSLNNSSSMSYEQSVHDMYTPNLQNKPVKAKLFQEKDQKKLQNRSENSLNFSEPVNHLIIDIDDINKQKTLADYKKISSQQQNKQPPNQKNKQKKENMKKSKVVITPIDYYVPDQVFDESFSKNQVYYPKVSPIGHKYQRKNEFARYKQQYDQTIRVGDRNQKNLKYLGSPQNVRKSDLGLQTQRQYISIHDKYEISNGINRKANRMRYPSEIQDTYMYHTQQNSVHQGRLKKHYTKQQVRERAMALLKRVRSDERIPVYEHRRSQIQSYNHYH